VVFAAVCCWPSSTSSSAPHRLALSRRRESLADVSGVELTRNPAGDQRSEETAAERQAIQEHESRHRFMRIDDPLQHHESWYHRLYDPPSHRTADSRTRENRCGPVRLIASFAVLGHAVRALALVLRSDRAAVLEILDGPSASQRLHLRNPSSRHPQIPGHRQRLRRHRLGDPGLRLAFR